MGLKDLKVRTAEIKVPGGSTIAVRGLSASDIGWLIGRHEEGIQTIFDRITGRLRQDSHEGEADPFNFGALAFSLVRGMPELAASVIACACDERDAEGEAAMLPLDVQIDAINRVCELTFATEGGAKKALETVVRMLSGFTQSVQTLQD